MIPRHRTSSLRLGTHQKRRFSCLVPAALLLIATTLEGHDVARAPTAVDGIRTRPSNSSSDSGAVLAVVRRFHATLAAADSTGALGLLAADVLIIEGGDVQTREQYRSHHLSADIAFARAVPSNRQSAQVVVRGDVAWVASTSVTEGTYSSRAINSAGAELAVLSRERDGWKIRAIHWSSHSRRSAQ